MVGCGAAFGWQLSLGDEVQAFVRAYGFVPERLTEAVRALDDTLFVAIGTVFSSMFLHGGWLHVIGNLLYLRVFGDNIEDRLGHLGYPIFYLAGGAAGALGQYSAHPGSDVPMVGASGAIAAVLGAYMVLFPKARVVTLFPIFIFLTFIEVPAVVFLAIWVAQQLLYGFGSLTGPSMVVDQVAWFAHLGGFAFGLVVGVTVRARGPRRRRAK